MVVVARSTEKHYAESKRSARDRHPGRASQKDNTLHTAQTDHSSFTSLAPASTWTCNIFSHCYNAFPPKSLCLSSGISILHTQKTRLNLHYHSITSAKRQAYILLGCETESTFFTWDLFNVGGQGPAPVSGMGASGANADTYAIEGTTKVP